MKKINVLVTEDIDYNFRIMASKKFKFKTGWYSNAVREAMIFWMLYQQLSDSPVVMNKTKSSCILNDLFD
ncbi:hypothetical protein JCM15415_11100 [Methanobacterium movens]|jgi:hypothetical protein|nr:MAG: hypothetical protein CIT03_01125 [Methanobacterium sp.]